MNRSVNNIKTSSNEEQQINIKALLGRILEDWWVVVLCLFLCIGTVYGFLRYKTPMYKINAKLMVQDEKKGGGSINAGEMLGDLSGLLNMKSNVDNEAEILKTRNLMERVVKASDLNIIYLKKGTFKDPELQETPFTVKLVTNNDTIRANSYELSVSEDGNTFEVSYKSNQSQEKIISQIKFGDSLFIEGIGKIIIRKNPVVPFISKKYIFRITSVDERVAALQKELKVSVTSKLVTTIDLNLNYSLPKKGEEILSGLIEEYIRQNINDKNKIADSTIAFIENRLTLVGGELGSIEGNIQNFKQGNKLADLSEQSKLLITNTSDYINRIAVLETQINIMISLEDYLKDGVKNKRVVPASVLPQDVVFGELVKNYNGLLLERDRQLLTSTEDNPYIKNLDERIAAMRNAMISNLSGTRKSLEINRGELQKEIDKLESSIRKVPAQERIYLDLARQQQIKQELYLFLLQKREEMAISKTSNISNAKIIDFPKSEFKPYSPNKQLIFLIGLIAAFLLPFARIYIIDLFNDRIQSKEEIIKHTNIPIVGEISHNDSENNLVISNDPRSVISEQFRALRTNLQFFMNAPKGNIILMTSSMSGEGKSFTVVNLGTVLAISGKKVLLMELDLRKPNLSPSFKIINDFGFTNYIISPETKISDIVMPTKIHENLFIIPSGPLPPNPAETIMSERMEKLMEELKKEYDYILMDAPPIGLVTDAQLLNKYTSITLYLIRQKYTYKNQLSIPQELYVNDKMKKMGIVINDIKKTYGYGYGYGYGNEEAKGKSWLKKMKEMFS